VVRSGADKTPLLGFDLRVPNEIRTRIEATLRRISMRGVALIVFAFMLCICAAAGQQAPSMPASPAKEDAGASLVPVYSVGPDVTAPELLTADLPVTKDKCIQKDKGKISLSLFVDANGIPQNVMFVHPLGTELDRLALYVAEADRFKPGTHAGSPAAVSRLLELTLEGCVEQAGHNLEKGQYLIQLRAQPVQNLSSLPDDQDGSRQTFTSKSPWSSHQASSDLVAVKDGVHAPRALNSPDLKYTEAARSARIIGVCLVRLIVDAHGMPQDPKIITSLDPGLDRNALIAVSQYRFRPAMKPGGDPVPVLIEVQVNFRLY
jgi:TonB family protein